MQAVSQKTTRSLSALFEPRSVAVIGASRNKETVGYAVLNNLAVNKFSGKIYPVNPKADTLEGLKCYPTVLDIPEPVDLAVIIIPSKFVNETVEQCGKKGVKGLIVISAGFREVGKEGAQIERGMVETALKYNMPVMGPNCLGLLNTDPKICLNASFSRTMPKEGNVAFISQSGALATAVLDYAKGENFGFSKFISMGNKADINEIDFLRALKDDPATKVILLYLEDIKDRTAFMEIAREITSDTSSPKAILALKSGRTLQGAKAASSHTGSLMGSDEMYDAIFAQCGVVRVDSAEEMFNLAIAFSFEPIPRGNRVAIVTNAGGPGIMATDACIRNGLQVGDLSPTTREELKKVLPATASVANPVDVIGDAHFDRYENTLKILSRDDNVDSVFVICTPQAMTDIEDTAKAVTRFANGSHLPVVTSFMGSVDVAPGVEVLEKNRLAHYKYPEEAARALGAMYKFKQWLDRPRTDIKYYAVENERAQKVLETAKENNQKALLIHQAMQVFESYGLPLLPYFLVHSNEEAVQKAKAVGFPVVLKVVSHEVIHKIDVGGVRLNVTTAEEVKSVYEDMTAKISAAGAKIEGVLVQAMAPRKGREVILGMNRDPQFGPVLMFGLGGIYVEALKDVSFRMAPIRELDARKMVEGVRTFTLLKGVRGEEPADLNAIIDCLQRLSQLSCEQPLIKEIDINPLLVYNEGAGAHALDARIILS